MRPPATNRRRLLHAVLAMALLAPSSGAFALERSPAMAMQGTQGHHRTNSDQHDCCPNDDGAATACAAFCAAAASAALPSAAPAMQRAANASFLRDDPEHAPPALAAPPLLRPPSR
jgi:hypothetical protein